MPEALAGGWKAPGRARHGLPCRATASGKSPFCGAFRKRGRRPRAINGCGSSSIAWPITTSPMHHKACGTCPERASGSGKPNSPAPGAAATALFPVLITFPPAAARGDRHADIPYRSWPARHDVDNYGVANGRRSGFAKTIFGWRCRKNCYRRLQHGRRTTWRPPAPWWRPVFDVCRPALARAI